MLYDTLALTEEDIKFKYITPAIENVGWDKDNVFYEYYITNGAVQVRGDKVTRGKRKKADYVLTYGVNKKPLAIIEAKKMNYSIGHGMPQAMEYAQMLDVKFAYSSNENGISYEYTIPLIFAGNNEHSLDKFKENLSRLPNS